MRKRLLLVTLLILSTGPGCSHFPFFGKSSVPPKQGSEVNKLATRQKTGNFVKKGKIVDAERLKPGGNIVIIPFRASVGVEASDELDRIALMIVKGFAEVVENDSDRHFRILTDESSENADFVVQGHISELKGPSKVRRWIMLKGQKMLGIDGKMVDARSQEPVAIFEDQVETKDDDYMGLGYRAGRNIGNLILSGIK